MSSGITVDDQCMELFQNLKLKKAHRFIVFGLSDDDKRIVPYFASTRDENYGCFRSKLDDKRCAFAVYDFEYQKSPQEGIRNKIAFIIWAPSTAPIRAKMLCASSKDALRKKLVGVQFEIQATDDEEISYEYIEEQYLKSK